MKIHEETTGVVTVEITQSAEQNHLRSADLVKLTGVFNDLAKRTDLRVLILTGEGEAFCRGRIGKAGLTAVGDILDDLNLILDVNRALNNLPMPVIAAVEGCAFGFGCGFATQCDITFAAEDAKFALPEMSHGLPPAIVMSYFSKFAPVKKAFEYAVTSKEFDAKTADEFGIVNHVVPKGTTLAHAKELAETIKAMDASSVSLLRSFCRRVSGMNDDLMAQYGASILAISLSSRAAH